MSQPDTEPEQVFEELLAEWRQKESTIIGEYGSDFDAEEDEADRVMEKWRERFRAAMKTVGEL